MSVLTRWRNGARRFRSDDGFTLVESLFSLAIMTVLVGGVGYLIYTFTVDTNRSSAQAIAHRQMTSASTLMAADVGRAQLLSEVSNGFDAAGSTPAGVWETLWRIEGSDVVKYHWSGAPGAAYPGPASVTTAGSRQVISHGIDAAASTFAFYNSVGVQLPTDGTAPGATAQATAMTGATAPQKSSPAVARVTWNLAATPGKLVTLQKPIADVTMQGGNAKANPATSIPTTTLTCPSPLISSNGSGKVTLRWVDAPGADSYAIKRNGTQIAIQPGGASEYSYLDAATPASQVSTYTVQTQVSGATTRTIPTCSAVSYVPAPVITGNVTATGTFQVTWPPITGVTSYTCYSRTVNYSSGSPSGAWTVVSTGAGTSCTVTPNPGDEDQFQVTASAPPLPDGSVPTSDTSNVVTLLSGPGAPTMLSQNFTAANGYTPNAAYPLETNTASNGDEYPVGGMSAQSNQVHWYATGATVGYHVYAATNGGPATLVATITQPASAVPYTGSNGSSATVIDSPVFKAVPLGSTTVYTVRAYNVAPSSAAQTESAPSNAKSVLQYPPAPTVAPLSPASLNTHDVLGANVVQWSAAASAVGYHVESAPNGTAGDGTFTCADSSCTTNSSGIKALKLSDSAPAGSRTDYRVRAYNATGLSPVYSSKVIVTQAADAPTPSLTNAPDLNSSVTNFASTQTGDSGNPSGYKFCAAGSLVCQYRLVKDGRVVDTAPQMSGSTTNWCYDPGSTCSYPNGWGDTFDYQVQVKNGALYNGGWSDVGPVREVNTYPSAFDMNKVSWSTAQTATGLGKQYTYQAPGDSSVSGSTSPTIDLSWGAASGVGLKYRYRMWAPGQSTSWDAAFSTARSYHNVPITDGNHTYNVQVQVQAANGLTRGGSDPTASTDCALATPSTSDSSCSAAIQSSPLAPERIGEVQQYASGSGGNYYGHAYWAVKWYVAGNPVGSDSYSNWDYATSWHAQDSSGDEFASGATTWHNLGGYYSSTTPKTFKGGQSRYSFYIVARSTRSGVLNPTTYSQTIDMELASGNPDVWGDSGGLSGTQDAPYTYGNYPSSYGQGFIRYTTDSDSWATGERKPGTSWTDW